MSSEPSESDSADRTQLIEDLRVVMERKPVPVSGPAAPEVRLEGTQIGPYRVDKRLGVGGMAQVYRAYDVARECDVALKVLKPQYQADDNVRARFEREAGSMAGLEHANVVRIFGVERAAATRALVMELMPGGSLRRRIDELRIRRQPMDVGEAVGLIVQAARGIGAAHRQGIVHRDVKPSNLLLTAERTVKVADFGAIHVAEQTTWLTGLGQQIGTPAYMSPEQCTGDRVTPASDVYSLGATLFELLTGHTPFEVEEASPFAMMLKHVSDPAPDPRLLRGDVPDWLALVVLRTLEKKPKRRYDTGDALADALEAGPAAVGADEVAPESASGLELDMRGVRRQLEELPHRAIVCWACRCARRVQDLNADPRVERALQMAEGGAYGEEAAESRHSVSRALTRIHKLRAASLTAAYTDDVGRGGASAAASARSAAAAAACAAARCVEDAAADAAFAARSAIAALEAANRPVRDFWQAARADHRKLRQADLGAAGTIGRPIPPGLFDGPAGAG